MTEKARNRRSWIIFAVAVIVLILSLTGVLFFLFRPADQLILVPSLTSDHSNIVARGFVTEIQYNYTSYGLGTTHIKPYHIFPAVVVVNMSQILWTSNEVDSSLGYWKGPHSMGVQLRDVPIAYDASDIPDLASGQAVEFSGFYADITDAPNSFFITISPNINSSYLKIADFPLPISVGPVPRYLTYLNNETRIFLVSSSAKFTSYPQDIYPRQPSFPDMHKGDPCVVVTATFRNDYSDANPPPGGFAKFTDKNYSVVALYVSLFDENGPVGERVYDERGNLIGTYLWDVSPGYEDQLYSGQRSYGIIAGENLTINFFLDTANMGINRFEIGLGYLGDASLP